MELLNLNINSPIHLKNQITLKNRVVIPPMASGTATSDGFVTESTLRHYKRLTEAGAGLIIAEYSYVSSNGRSEENQLGIQSNLHIDGLAKIAKIIKNANSISGIQLTHSGGKSDLNLTRGKLLAPSSIPTPVKGRMLQTPKAMSIFEIQQLKNSFVLAAIRASEAGFDLVELHAAHGYGLNQWISPITNKRTDHYGGSIENRCRVLFEIVQAIKSLLPKLLLSVRIPGQDFISDGLTKKDSLWIARQLERHGVDILNVSSGIGGWQRPDIREGEGYLVSEAFHIQKEVSIPTIGVGGIKTHQYINKGLNAGWFSLAAVGRAILDDPFYWNKTNL